MKVTSERKWTTAAGFVAECIVIETPYSYHRCGYVLIPDGHPLHGKSYSEPLPGVSLPEDATIGKRGVIPLVCAAGKGLESPSMDLLFDVHGSITFAGERATADRFWIGFDCNHVDDDPSVYDTEYVVSECESLAAQINTHFPGYAPNVEATT